MNAPPAPRPSFRPFDAVMAATLEAQGDIEALASVDVSRGEVIRSATRGDRSQELLGFAALAASSVCSAPRLDADDDFECNDALIVSESAVHAFAPARGQPGRVVVGIAGGGANVALLVASVRRVADALGD